ncbi:MAG: hypothetical protein ABW185_30005, partial [Sedimenticola sp.]
APNDADSRYKQHTRTETSTHADKNAETRRYIPAKPPSSRRTQDDTTRYNINQTGYQKRYSVLLNDEATDSTPIGRNKHKATSPLMDETTKKYRESESDPPRPPAGSPMSRGDRQHEPNSNTTSPPKTFAEIVASPPNTPMTSANIPVPSTSGLYLQHSQQANVSNGGNMTVYSANGKTSGDGA